MPPQPKKSRKTFPKWTPGNASRKYHGDRTYPAKPLLRAAEASLPHDVGSSSIIKERRALGNAAGTPRSLAGSPHPASAFTPPSTFVTMAIPGTSQGEEDGAGPATRGNPGCKLGHRLLGLFYLVLNGRLGWGPAELPGDLCFAPGLSVLSPRATKARNEIFWSFPPGRSPPGGPSKGRCLCDSICYLLYQAPPLSPALAALSPEAKKQSSLPELL